MTYYVTLAVEGRYVAFVEADSIEEAKRLGKEDFWTANLNEMECVEGDVVTIEDEKGEITYEA